MRNADKDEEMSIPGLSFYDCHHLTIFHSGIGLTIFRP